MLIGEMAIVEITSMQVHVQMGTLRLHANLGPCEITMGCVVSNLRVIGKNS